MLKKLLNIVQIIRLDFQALQAAATSVIVIALDNANWKSVTLHVIASAQPLSVTY